MLPLTSPPGLDPCRRERVKALIFNGASRKEMIDFQQNTSHPALLGGREIARQAFIAQARPAAEPAPPRRFGQAVPAG